MIPKDTWVQGNIWAIHHSDREFPDPDRFNPDRFYDSNSPDRGPFPNEKGYMTFGWGRRTCVGQALAEQGTFISIARLLWGFNIRKARDLSTGEEIPVDIFDYTYAVFHPPLCRTIVTDLMDRNGLNMRPNPFSCAITPRSDEIRETIEREERDALERLAVYNGTTKYRMSTYYMNSS